MDPLNRSTSSQKSEISPDGITESQILTSVPSPKTPLKRVSLKTIERNQLLIAESLPSDNPFMGEFSWSKTLHISLSALYEAEYPGILRGIGAVIMTIGAFLRHLKTDLLPKDYYLSKIQGLSKTIFKMHPELRGSLEEEFVKRKIDQLVDQIKKTPSLKRAEVDHQIQILMKQLKASLMVEPTHQEIEIDMLNAEENFLRELSTFIEESASGKWQFKNLENPSETLIQFFDDEKKALQDKYGDKDGLIEAHFARFQGKKSPKNPEEWINAQKQIHRLISRDLSKQLDAVSAEQKIYREKLLKKINSLLNPYRIPSKRNKEKLRKAILKELLKGISNEKQIKRIEEQMPIALFAPEKLLVLKKRLHSLTDNLKKLPSEIKGDFSEEIYTQLETNVKNVEDMLGHMIQTQALKVISFKKEEVIAYYKKTLADFLKTADISEVHKSVLTLWSQAVELSLGMISDPVILKSQFLHLTKPLVNLLQTPENYVLLYDLELSLLREVVLYCRSITKEPHKKELLDKKMNELTKTYESALDTITRGERSIFKGHATQQLNQLLREIKKAYSSIDTDFSNIETNLKKVFANVDNRLQAHRVKQEPLEGSLAKTLSDAFMAIQPLNPLVESQNQVYKIIEDVIS